MIRQIAFVLIGMIFLFGIAVAQVSAPNLPSTFTVTLNSLPPQQSASQIIFSCPYSETIEHRISNVFSQSGTQSAPQVELEVQFWTNDRRCAGSQLLNLTLSSSSTPQQMVTNLNAAINSAFIEEANSNNQPFNAGREPIAVGGN